MTYVYGKKEEKAKPFKLTSPEKQLIRAYVRYKRATCFPATAADILEMFKWDDPTHERYVPAFQDFFSDNPTYRGEFKRVRTAILEYIQVCKDKLDEKI